MNDAVCLGNDISKPAKKGLYLMDKMILWSLLVFGIVLFIFSLRKPPRKDWVLIFFLTSYFTIFFGTIVVRKKMLAYPVNFLNDYFSSSLLYEHLLYPVICIYFYQTSYHSNYLGILLQAALYTGALTIVEVLLERYTNLIQYHTWNWHYTFISVYFLMIFVRSLMKLINRTEG
jgi:hypothetical protein